MLVPLRYRTSGIEYTIVIIVYTIVIIDTVSGIEYTIVIIVYTIVIIEIPYIGY